ncbi:FMN-binding negative transcriptional regulator [Colwellia psychrerythraea]|uniref:FMN-binding negative transcriptional regulator n=1 Tax=Colwellia psychrerythraea TaxID=28229 RepID=A0A099KEK2_COLPS|nr:FMN-binding negative transcriptional regulator [Colwellia psychrerythraea]KGJ89169.1 FMN-binding negative transcriptional regulator [Colwellia psychrerythraea]
MCQVKQHIAPKYPAEHFVNIKQQLALLDVIEQRPLATLLYLDSNVELQISHIPFHFNESTITSIKEKPHQELIGYELMAHVSNQHPLAQHLSPTGLGESKNIAPLIITLIFHGEDDYISPNDVSDEQSTQQKVPTWNYAKVHVVGHVTEVSHSDEKYQHMSTSSDYFEQIKVQQALTSADKNTPWSLNDTPKQAIAHMLNAITVFKLTISHIEGRFKLSQNKPIPVRIEIAEQVARRKKTFLAQQIRQL